MDLERVTVMGLILRDGVRACPRQTALAHAVDRTRNSRARVRRPDRPTDLCCGIVAERHVQRQIPHGQYIVDPRPRCIDAIYRDPRYCAVTRGPDLEHDLVHAPESLATLRIRVPRKRASLVDQVHASRVAVNGLQQQWLALTKGKGCLLSLDSRSGKNSRESQG